MNVPVKPVFRLSQLRRYPSGVLLVTQLLALVLYPFVDGTDAGRIAFGIVGVVVLAVTTGMVRRTPFDTGVSVCLAVPSIVLLLAQMAFDLPHLLAWSAGFEALFYFYAAGSLTAYMLADRRATADELLAAGGTFTLLAWALPTCSCWSRRSNRIRFWPP